jgi:hypothetical protein
MVDAGAIPLQSGIAVCSANAPRQLPTAHAVEAGEAGPSGVSQISRWESDATSTLQLSILLLFLMTEPGHSQKI